MRKFSNFLTALTAGAAMLGSVVAAHAEGTVVVY
jgi:hypothetical protein